MFHWIVSDASVKVRSKFDGSLAGVVDRRKTVNQVFKRFVAGIVVPFVHRFGKKSWLQFADLNERFLE